MASRVLGWVDSTNVSLEKVNWEWSEYPAYHWEDRSHSQIVVVAAHGSAPSPPRISPSFWLERPRCARETLGREVRECAYFGRQVSAAGIYNVDVARLNIERWQHGNEATFAHVRTHDEVRLECGAHPPRPKRDPEATPVGIDRSPHPYRSLPALAVPESPDLAQRRVCVG